MKKAIKFFLLSILLSCSFSISKLAYANNKILQPYRATYLISYDGIKIGKSIITLTNSSPHHYLFCINNLTTLPFIYGKITECSKGIILKNTVRPESYSYHYEHGKHEQLTTINFNWEKHIAIITAKGKTWQMHIDNGTQDKISYQLLLRQDLMANKKDFRYLIADGGKIKNYTFKIISREIIQTPFGNFISTKLIRLPIPHKENVTLWYAKELGYIVIKAKQSKQLINWGTAEIDTLSTNLSKG